MTDGTIWEHLTELRHIIILVITVVAGWLRMEQKTMALAKEHTKLKDQITGKTDKTTCEQVHAMSRENQQIIISAIESGIADVRGDIKHVNERLDTHIQQNGVMK